MSKKIPAIIMAVLLAFGGFMGFRLIDNARRPAPPPAATAATQPANPMPATVTPAESEKASSDHAKRHSWHPPVPPRSPERPVVEREPAKKAKPRVIRRRHDPLPPKALAPTESAQPAYPQGNAQSPNWYTGILNGHI